MNKLVKTNLGNKEIFIRNVKRHLANSGKKQIDACKAIGVSTGTFSDWMKGRSYPRMDKIQLLAEYLVSSFILGHRVLGGPALMNPTKACT